MPLQRGIGAAALAAAVLAPLCWIARKWRQGRPSLQDAGDEPSDSERSSAQQQQRQQQKQKQHEHKEVPKQDQKQKQPQRRNKGAERLEWWQRLNEVKPVLTLPDLGNAGEEALQAAQAVEAVPKAYLEVVRVAEDRLHRGRDWLVRDSDYGSAPAHGAVKAKVNAALVREIINVFGHSLAELIAQDFCRLLLILDTPQYGSLRDLASAFPGLRCCQQVVIPQADLRHYFEMVRSSEFYPGVRAQRLDHWLCANAGLGLSCLASFLDFECRLVGALSARLCPAADIIRYFRCGYPAKPASVLALTVGLEHPAETPEEVDAFVRWEAALNGYSVELKESWKYRMVTLLYVVRHVSGGPSAAVKAL